MSILDIWLSLDAPLQIGRTQFLKFGGISLTAIKNNFFISFTKASLQNVSMEIWKWNPQVLIYVIRTKNNVSWLDPVERAFRFCAVSLCVPDRARKQNNKFGCVKLNQSRPEKNNEKLNMCICLPTIPQFTFNPFNVNVVTKAKEFLIILKCLALKKRTSF